MDDSLRMKRLYISISILAIAVLGFFLSQDALARLAWQRYGRADMALALVRNDAGLAAQLGNYYFSGGAYDLARAKNAYMKAVAADDKILWGHYQLARIIFVQGDFENSIVEINRELEANPENLRSLYVRGLIYGYRNLGGDLEKAEADFRRFTEWAPREWAGYNDLAWVLSKAGKYREARDTVKKAFQEIPDAGKNPWLWNSLGVAELNLGNYGNAERAFAKAKELALGLTEKEWRISYPGNNPGSAAEGLRAFRGALEENLSRARTGASFP